MSLYCKSKYDVCVFQAMRTQTELELRLFKQNKHVYDNMREAVLSKKPLMVAGEQVPIKATS